MIYGNYIQTVPTLQSEKEAMLEALENELTYYNQLFLNESCFLDENTKMILEAKREVLQEAVGAALIAAIIAAIGALIALIIKGTKSVASKAVEVVKNTNNKSDHIEKIKKYKEKSENKSKTSNENEDNEQDNKYTDSRFQNRIEQKPKEIQKNDKTIEKAKIYYDKFIKDIGSKTLQNMTVNQIELSPSINKYFDFDYTDDLNSPFFKIDSAQFNGLKFLIQDMTNIAKQALSGESKFTNKEDFDYLRDMFSPRNVLISGSSSNIAAVNAYHNDNMDELLEIYSKELRSTGSILYNTFCSFQSEFRGNDINPALNSYIEPYQKQIKILKSFEEPLKKL